jgi:two-component system phosphate regulon response regulator PhoB
MNQNRLPATGSLVARTIGAHMDESTPPLVLVVDDDDRARELMQIILRHAGYRVIDAADAQAATALLEAERPVILLVDFLMPGMTGLDFCRWVRVRPELAGLRVVLLTGMDGLDTREEAEAAGVDAVVTKPFDRRDLLDQLAQLQNRP